MLQDVLLKIEKLYMPLDQYIMFMRVLVVLK